MNLISILSGISNLKIFILFYFLLFIEWLNYFIFSIYLVSFFFFKRNPNFFFPGTTPQNPCVFIIFFLIFCTPNKILLSMPLIVCNKNHIIFNHYTVEKEVQKWEIIVRKWPSTKFILLQGMKSQTYLQIYIRVLHLLISPFSRTSHIKRVPNPHRADIETCPSNNPSLLYYEPSPIRAKKASQLSHLPTTEYTNLPYLPFLAPWASGLALSSGPSSSST